MLRRLHVLLWPVTALLCVSLLYAAGVATAQEETTTQQKETSTQEETTKQEDAAQKETKAERRKRKKAERDKKAKKTEVEKQEVEDAKAKKGVKKAGGEKNGDGKSDDKSDEKKAKDALADKKAEAKKKADAKKKELTLKNLFPEKSMFGSRATRPAFSTDGRFAAYLYRPRIERRHGSDLWLYDFETKTNTRLTNVVMMSEFQKSARKVKDDRLKKAKKTQKPVAGEKDKSDKSKKDEDKKTEDKDDSVKQGEGQEGDAKQDGKGEKELDGKDGKQGVQDDKKEKKEKKSSQVELTDEDVLKIVSKVSDKDADDEKAPRYGGVSSFTWHPETNSLLLSSEGDVYQVADVSRPQLVRLTKTQSRESRANYLPDGSGFTFSNDDVVYRVRFGQYLVEQINPRLTGGLELGGYEVSPDGKRLVVVGRTPRRSSGARTVDYIRYRDRFAKASSVSRTVSDDKTTPTDVVVYLYDLEKAATEEAELIQIFKTKIDEPRDVISSPEWSLDSSKVTFCFFDQKKSEVQILLGEFPKADKDDKDGKADAKTGDKVDEKAAEKKPAEKKDDGKLNENPARVVYRFQHFGGPNTPRMVAPEFAWDSHHIVFVSEQSGFRHVHILDPLYESLKQLTNGHYEVYPQRMSKDHRYLFVTATKNSSAREMVYSINLESGEMLRVSKQDGTYSSVAVSNDGKRLVSNFVTYGQLTELIRQDEGKTVEVLTDSHTDIAKHFTKTVPEFFEYKNRHGHAIKGMLIKPDGWKKDKKHPLLIYVYGGPLGTRKSVVDGSYSSSAYFFNSYMAKTHNYVTVVIDPRGQSGYGGVFEKANYEQVGKPQVEDLVDGVKHLTSEYNIDNKKVGIFGWSFGGFQTQMCLYTKPDVFQVGMAGAGPTEWENYNSWYSTGTIGPAGTDKPEQKKYSLLPLAKNLKGKLLLTHGMEDTNVLFQDTVKVYRELLKAGKETNVELFLDPTGSHGLGGDVKRLNRYRKYEEFLLRTLGEG